MSPADAAAAAANSKGAAAPAAAAATGATAAVPVAAAAAGILTSPVTPAGTAALPPRPPQVRASLDGSFAAAADAPRSGCAADARSQAASAAESPAAGSLTAAMAQRAVAAAAAGDSRRNSPRELASVGAAGGGGGGGGNGGASTLPSDVSLHLPHSSAPSATGSATSAATAPPLAPPPRAGSGKPGSCSYPSGSARAPLPQSSMSAGGLVPTGAAGAGALPADADEVAEEDCGAAASDVEDGGCVSDGEGASSRGGRNTAGQTQAQRGTGAGAGHSSANNLNAAAVGAQGGGGGARELIKRLCRSHATRTLSNRSLRVAAGRPLTYAELQGESV